MAGDRLAFPWARTYDADQLAAFIEDLWGAASGDNDLATLDAIEKVVAEHRPAADPSAVACPLPESHLAVLIAAADGETTTDTAKRFGISKATVYTRRQRACARLGVRTVEQAVAMCAAHDWFPLGALHLPEPPRKVTAQSSRMHRAQAALLRQQPGVWHPVATYASRRASQVAASRIRLGSISAYRPGGAYEALPFVQDGTHGVRARYIDRSAPAAEKAASS